MTDTTVLDTDLEFVRSPLDHSSSTNSLVRGINVVVHPGAVDPQATPSEQLDYQMRCTYNLLRACVEEGVSRFVYLSTLHLFDLYEEGMAVTERWKPRPTTDPTQLCFYLGEMICREFAREHGINVAILRLGDLTDDDSQSPAPTALFAKDAIDAVTRTLTAELSGWLDIFHVQSQVGNSRYLTGQPWWSADDVSAPAYLGSSPDSMGGSQ